MFTYAINSDMIFLSCTNNLHEGHICRDPRNVLPSVNEFRPLVSADEWVVMTDDEYEAIRLIDKEGFSKEKYSVYM